ncbi:MAG: tetrahydrofolate dehydrogenase/cyclohydrolase catalytic domain-containing protein, partial [Calditrichota bacterium]
MTAIRIDGKATALEVREEVRLEVAEISDADNRPGLAVILVGDDPASQIYVRSKGKACEKAGIFSETRKRPADITEEQLLKEIDELNNDPKIHGILVQLPLPKHVDEQKVIEAISPDKDVDGFHPYNVGRMMIGLSTFFPATPAGIVELLKRYKIETKGKHVVVIGRSNIVG